MVKVSIIPTILIWIVVTFLRIASHSIEPKINNLRNIRSIGEKSNENNHLINLWIDKKIPIVMTDRRKRSSRLIYTGPVKLKFSSPKLIDDSLDDGELKTITEADSSIGKSNGISDLNSENNRRSFNDTHGINDENGFRKRLLLISKMNVTNSADSDTAFDEGEIRLKDIVNASELRDKNLTKRDNVSSVLKKEIEKNILRNFLNINNKTAKLTLADLNGPSISQDVESLADEKSRGFEHIRVKRDLSDSDSVDEITNEEDFNALLKDDDESEMRNDLNRKILIRRNELNNETRSAIVKPEFRSGIDEREIGSKDSLKARSEFRKKRYALQSQVVGRVSRGGRKKSHRRPHKHKHHRKRPKYNKHFKKMAKISKDNKKRNDVGDYRSRKIISKSNNSPGKISAVVADELEIESRVEKRDSGDARSEIDVKKREVLKKDELLASKKSETLNSGVASSSLISGFKDKGMIDGRDDDGGDLISKSGEDLLRVKRHEKGIAAKDKISNNELKYYEDVRESNRVQRGADVGLRGTGDWGKKRQRERAEKSVKEIKNLMDKLVGKVNELDSYVEKRWENDERRVKSKEKKRGDEEDSLSLTRCVDADLKNIKKSEDSITCVDKTFGGDGGGGFKSKLETERSGRQGVGDRSGEITSGERKRSALTSKRNDISEKMRKKRKPHRKWDRWTDWSSCSVTCGKGRQIRWRHCVHDCTLAETEMEEKTCQLPACGPGKFLGIF